MFEFALHDRRWQVGPRSESFESVVAVKSQRVEECNATEK